MQSFLSDCHIFLFDIEADLMNESMIGVLGHDSALSGYTGPGTTWVNGINFVMNHALAQDRSLDLMVSSPAHYHCTMDAHPSKR